MYAEGEKVVAFSKLKLPRPSIWPASQPTSQQASLGIVVHQQVSYLGLLSQPQVFWG